MPIYIRVLILLGIYLIYLLTEIIRWRHLIKNVDTKQKERIGKKCLYSFSIKIAMLLVLTFCTFTEYIFFSYNKIILLVTYLLVLILECLYSLFSKKNEVRLTIIAIGICIPALVISTLSLLCCILNNSYIPYFLNPSEVSNQRYEETTISDITVNLYDLEYENDVENSIGFKIHGGAYFFYYKNYNKRNIKKEILPTEVKSVTPIFNEDTYIIAEETKYDIIYTERRPESKYYKKEVSEIKYRMYINPEQYVQVDE